MKKIARVIKKKYEEIIYIYRLIQMIRYRERDTIVIKGEEIKNSHHAYR